MANYLNFIQIYRSICFKTNIFIVFFDLKFNPVKLLKFSAIF